MPAHNDSYADVKARQNILVRCLQSVGGRDDLEPGQLKSVLDQTTGRATSRRPICHEAPSIAAMLRSRKRARLSLVSTAFSP